MDSAKLEATTSQLSSVNFNENDMLDFLNRDKAQFLGIRINTGSISEFTNAIVSLSLARTHSYVCFANAHMTVEASKYPTFSNVVNASTITCPDGMPIAKSITWFFGKRQRRISGPEMLPILLSSAHKHNLKVFVLGGTTSVLESFLIKADIEYPGVVCGVYSPPFRPLSDSENHEIIDKIKISNANMVFVSLGCPKQEIWMYNFSKQINSCLLGLGFAVPVYAGHSKRAPHWMQRMGLEWLHRLNDNPKNLWRRYLFTNTKFMFLLAKETLKNNLLRRA